MDPTIAKPPAGSLSSPQAWAALRAVGISQTYPPAVSLFEQGTPVKAIGVIAEGLVNQIVAMGTPR